MEIFAKFFFIKIATIAVSISCLMYKNTNSQHLTVKMHSFLNKFDIKDTEG